MKNISNKDKNPNALPDIFKDCKPASLVLIAERSTLIQIVHLLSMIRYIINNKAKAEITVKVGYNKNGVMAFSLNDNTVPDYKHQPVAEIN